MTRAVAIAVLVGFATSCGPSGTTKTDPVPHPDPPAPSADAGTDPQPAAADAGPVVVEPTPDPRARCARVVDHMLDVALTEYPKTDHATIREKMTADRDRLVDECTRGTLTDDEYDCVMAAQTAAAMQKCAQQ